MREYFADANEYQQFLVRSLAHYNVWLMDSNRSLTDRYPGFPEEQQLLNKGKKKMSNVMNSVVDQLTAKPAAPKKTEKVKRAKRAGGPTKGDLALEIYRGENGDKQSTIGRIQSELGMSLAGATTYFYNAKKASK